MQSCSLLEENNSMNETECDLAIFFFFFYKSFKVHVHYTCPTFFYIQKGNLCCNEEECLGRAARATIKYSCVDRSMRATP